MSNQNGREVTMSNQDSRARDLLIQFSTVPDHEVELSDADHQAMKAIIRYLNRCCSPPLEPGNLIVLESTSPVGTTGQLSRWLGDARPDLTFPHDNGEDAEILVAYCPERVMPGNVLAELIHNDRTIGGLSRKSSERAVALYDLFLEGECLITDARTAEMVKLSEN
ncbi:MAG: hypothetical protein IH921_05010, partial [Gemmatimonadetes bacterium]|nr:hypothetical protein [Gemmatimonadota bacterium]